MTHDTPNPYLSDLSPFAGRQAVFARLHQHFNDSTRREAALIVGQPHMGKTALLRQFSSVFDETFVSLLIPLSDLPLTSEADFLRTLFQRTSAVLGERGFTLTRLTDPPEDADHLALRTWFADIGLPELTTTIRPHRRLVWLFDDAQHLLNAIVTYRFAIDHFSYLQKLLVNHRQLHMVLTIDAQHETHLDALSPLASATDALRLTHLSLNETAALLRQPAVYTVPDDIAAEVHRAAGGHPLLLQRFGFHLWQSHADLTPITPAEVKAVASLVYIQTEADFREIWQTLTQTEQLILTAISSLLYHDPLRKIDTAAIQSWLVETDYPADSTAINAALRSLDYREILSHTANGVALTTGLLQKWLVDNARLNLAAPANSPLSNRRVFGLIAVAIILVTLILVIALNSSPPHPLESSPPPTATLVATATPLP